MRLAGNYVHVAQPPTAEHIIRNVRVLMDEKRINQTDLGAKLGMSQSALSRRLTGWLPFTIDELIKLAVVFDVDISALMTAPSKPQNEAREEAVAG